jgi:hypothetical protein
VVEATPEKHNRCHHPKAYPVAKEKKIELSIKFTTEGNWKQILDTQSKVPISLLKVHD